MTNKEALVATLQASVPDNALEKALADRGIVSAAIYGATQTAGIDGAAMDLLSGLLSAPDVSEGGYSVRFDRTAIKARLIFLANKYGNTEILSGLQPSVTSKAAW